MMVLCAAKDPASLEHDVLDALIGVEFLLDNLPLVDVIPAEVESSEIPSSSSGGYPKNISKQALMVLLRLRFLKGTSLWIWFAWIPRCG